MTVFSVRGERNRLVGLNKAFMLAHALDPWFKSLQKIPDWRQQKKIWTELLDQMVKMRPEEEESSRRMQSSQLQPPQPAAKATHKTSFFNNHLLELDSPESKHRQESENWHDKCKEELDHYKKMPPMTPKALRN